MFFGLPPPGFPIFLKEGPLTESERDVVADAGGRCPTEVDESVVGVIDIRLSGGGCNESGRERGRGKLVDEEALKP